MRRRILLFLALLGCASAQTAHVFLDLSGDWIRTDANAPAARKRRLPVESLQSEGPFRLERDIQPGTEGLNGLALLMTPLGGRFTVLVNGRNIGGAESAHPSVAPPMRCVVLPIPDGLLHGGVNQIVIEAGGIEVRDQITSRNLPVGNPLLGGVEELRVIARGYERAHMLRFLYAPFNTIAQLLFVVILIGLSRGSPHRKGLLWVALYFGAISLTYDLLITLDAFAGVTRTVRDLAVPFYSLVLSATLMEASLAFLRVNLPVPIRAAYYIALAAASQVPAIALVGRVHLPLTVNVVLLVWAIRTGNRIATLFQGLLVGYGLVSVLALPPFGWFGLFTLGQVGFHPIPGFRVVIGLGLILWVIRQSVRDRNERERLAVEIGAARAVQQLLVTRKIPGVEAAYLPAKEVGGDFYQLAVRQVCGTRLVLVGDVSGKGLQAAMVACVAVGAFRSTESGSPAEILGVMNRALAGQGHGGFVTCVCARIDGESITVANAGHPAPYVDGCEIDVEPGLPLGIDGEAEYSESVHPMQTQATFVSDGVIEASGATGELFGFDRTREISRQPAQAIAGAACAWGQNDDITVVTVQCTNQAG